MRKLSAAIVAFIAVAWTVPARADETPPAAPPCSMPAAVSLADRPGTGRSTSSGGSPCVAVPGEIVVESGARRQITTQPGGSIVLASSPLTFIRAGVTQRAEIGVALPAVQSRAVTGITPVDAAHGVTDIVFAAKYLVLDRDTTQGSIGVSYSPPTGTSEFTAGAATYSISANLGMSLTPKLSIATSQVFGTAVGADASGRNRSFFVWSPSFTLAYALDSVDTVLLQDALASRQGPVLPAGSRAIVALQRAIGNRVALDVDYEVNLAPTLGTAARALGFGFVWIAAPGRARAPTHK
jgi:hypothetical protein